MKILALGATGAIGSILAKTLADEGHDVLVTSRTQRAAQGTLGYLTGNAREDAFIYPILSEPWDAIVDFMIYDTRTFASRIKRFLQATDQYIFVSTGRVFASSETALQESSPRLLEVCSDAAYLATDEYALSKARQENLLRASGTTNWTIVRPYITFGEGRLQLGPLEKEDWLYRAMQGKSIVFCEALMDCYTTLTDSFDVAGMMSALIGREQALGEDFNLTNGVAVSWNRVLEIYLLELSKKRRATTPVMLQDVESFCMAANPAQVRYDRLYHRRFDTAKIAQFFNLSKFKDPLTALGGCTHAQLSGQIGFGPVNWRNEALRDRATGEHARMNEITGLKSTARYLAYRHLPIDKINRLRRR